MHIEFFPKDTRGHADHGWLKSYHAFSFADFHHQDRVHFGALRVLNEDTVAAQTGFDYHPHRDMEIVTIILEGQLEHRDSMQNQRTITAGEVQSMTAGSGVVHREWNTHPTDSVHLLQLWIFTETLGLAPDYHQTTRPTDPNILHTIAGPVDDVSASVPIHQQAWLYFGEFTEDTSLTKALVNADYGLYLYVVRGNVRVDTHTVTQGDSMGITDTQNVVLHIEAGTQLLVAEVPMHVGP